MSAAAIGGAASAVNSAPRGNGFGDLSSADFIKVMIAELSNQDPLEPQDSGALIEQFGNLRNVETQLQLQEQLGALVLQNQVAAAGGLIGKVVSGLDASNFQVQGLVTSVRVIDGQAVLELDSGGALPMQRVDRITELPGGGQAG